MNKMVSILAALGLVLGTGLGHAQVYKWVDQEGVTHYSQQPPETGAAKEIPVPGPAAAPAPATGSSSSGAPAASDEGKRTEQLTDEIRARRAEEDRKQADSDAQRSEACKQMRANLDTLRSHGRVRIQEQDSTRVMTPEEQAQQIIDLEKRIQENCAQSN